MKEFSSGAVRSTDAESVRYDLVSPVGLRRIAETYNEGSKKYGDFNWERGFPVSDILNHAIRHIYLYLEGYRHDPLTGVSEDHLAHAAWNLIAAMHLEEKKPECLEGLRPEIPQPLAFEKHPLESPVPGPVSESTTESVPGPSLDSSRKIGFWGGPVSGLNPVPGPTLQPIFTPPAPVPALLSTPVLSPVSESSPVSTPDPCIWRLLDPGEAVQKGDQCWYRNASKWVDSTCYVVVGSGNQSPVTIYRRRTPISELGTTVFYPIWRILDPGELIEDGDEYYSSRKWYKSINISKDQLGGMPYRRLVEEPTPSVPVPASDSALSSVPDLDLPKSDPISTSPVLECNPFSDLPQQPDSGSTPPAPVIWRLLDPGELVEKGDEYWNLASKRWRISSKQKQPQTSGLIYRRRLET